jgi:1-phosphofructokinase family hexose kinase
MLEALIGVEGLPQEWIWTDGETRTNMTIVERSSGRASRILEPGPRMTPVVTSMLRRRLLRRFRLLNAVVFTGSLPPGISPKFFADLIRSARRANVLTVLDTSGTALAEGLKARPFLVKPNRAEAETVCGFRIRSRTGVKKALQYFSKRCNIVLISLGKEGLVATDSTRMFWARGPIIRRGLAVGCGDTALAGFLAGFLKGSAFEDCLRLAVACGAANVGAERPGAVKRQRVKDIQARINVKRL